jgi:mono/diheme cytochrome c family protein
LRPDLSPGGARHVVLAVVAVGVLAATGAACRQDMHDQPKIKAYRESDFFGDRRGMRPIPEGTVARGFLQDDDLLYTGKVNGQPVDEFPFQVTRPVLERGHERFNIYCAPCHGRTGLGNGMVVQRGYKPPPSLHDDRIRQQAVGYYYDVMTNGFGAMPDYRAQVAPEDRWAIAAYIRALQYSQRATVNDVPEAKRTSLDHPQPVHAAEPVGHGGSH